MGGNKMAEFKPIETQEAFDEAIKERIAREREKFKDHDELRKKNEELAEQLNAAKSQLQESGTVKEEFEKQIAERDAKIKGYETDSAKTRIALEMGIPFEMGSRLHGDTEEEIRKDAEAIKDMLNITKPVAPSADPEGASKNSIEEAYANLINTEK